MEFQEDKVPSNLEKPEEENLSRRQALSSKQKWLNVLAGVQPRKRDGTLDQIQDPKIHKPEVNQNSDTKKHDVYEKIRTREPSAATRRWKMLQDSVLKNNIKRQPPKQQPFISNLPSKWTYGFHRLRSNITEEEQDDRKSEELPPKMTTDVVAVPPAVSTYSGEDNDVLGPLLVPETTQDPNTEASDRLVSGVQEYRMTARPRGFVYIINNKDFYQESIVGTRCNMPELKRTGSENDADALESLFGRDLNFKVRRYNNLKAVEILNFLRDISKSDHSQYDCFVCCICSHGRDDSVLGSDIKGVPIRTITNMFRNELCESLAGKPKLFFIQACKGEAAQSAVPGLNIYHADSVPEPEQLLPAKSDELIGYSTVEGYASFRSHTGSVYIQNLVKYIRHLRQTTDLCQILTKVNQKVGDLMYPLAGGRQGKQMPKFESTLRKLVYLRNQNN